MQLLLYHCLAVKSPTERNKSAAPLGHLERADSIDREDDQETPPGADRLTNFNTTLANSNTNNNDCVSCCMFSFWNVCS